MYLTIFMVYSIIIYGLPSMLIIDRREVFSYKLTNLILGPLLLYALMFLMSFLYHLVMRKIRKEKYYQKFISQSDILDDSIIISGALALSKQQIFYRRVARMSMIWSVIMITFAALGALGGFGNSLSN